MRRVHPYLRWRGGQKRGFQDFFDAGDWGEFEFFFDGGGKDGCVVQVFGGNEDFFHASFISGEQLLLDAADREDGAAEALA